MNAYEFAEQLLYGSEFSDKIQHVKLSDFNFEKNLTARKFSTLPGSPGRTKRLSFSDNQLKFPRRASFHLDEKKAMALHFFANHELLAIEMMAAAILFYDFKNTEEKNLFHRGLINTIIDEQKHLKLYVDRMKDWGMELGDLPLNDFFWTYMPDLKTPSMFYAAMALTFESANLDFAAYYSECFYEVGDEKTSKIMQIVFEDEISHVALGGKWLSQWKEDKTLWQYYLDNLPTLLTPGRARGINYQEEYRRRSNLDENFCYELTHFENDYRITNRKPLKLD